MFDTFAALLDWFGIVVFATTGALVASRKGYRTVLVVPDKMSREKIMHARALGAEVVALG